MFVSKRSAIAAFATLLSLCAADRCLAQQPDSVPRASTDGPKPYRVLGDRRVGFPLGSLVFSPDRKMLASVGGIYATGQFPRYKVFLIDVGTGKTLHELDMHTVLANQLAFAADGKTLYTGSRLHDGGASSRSGATLNLWDTRTGKLIKGMNADLWDLSPAGKVLAVNENIVDIDPRFGGQLKPAPSTYTLRLLDADTWQEVARLHEKGMTLQALRFTPDGKTLAIAASDYTIRLWDWRAKKEIGRIQAPKVDPQKWAGAAITILEFNPDGTRLASVSDTVYLNQVTRKIELWDVATRKAVQTLAGPQYPIVRVAFTPKGEKLAVSARQNYFNLFDLSTGKKLADWERPGNADLAAALYRDGVTPDQTPKGPQLPTRLWNLASGEDIVSGKLPSEPQSLAFAPDDRTLLVGDMKGVIRFYDIENGDEVRRIADSKSPVHGLTFLPAPQAKDGPQAKGQGRPLCVQTWDGLRFLDAETGKPAAVKLFAPLFRPSFAASADGKLAAATEGSIQVALWPDAAAKRPLVAKLPHGVRHLAFTPDGKKLVAGSWDGVIQVIDAKTGEVLKPVGREHVAMFALSPDGKRVAAWHRSAKYEWENHVALWDLDSGDESGRLPVKPSAFTGMRFTPDGRSLWIPYNGGIGLFHIGTGQLRALVQGTWPIALSSTGRFLACKGNDAIFVWDVDALINRK